MTGTYAGTTGMQRLGWERVCFKLKFMQHSLRVFHLD